MTEKTPPEDGNNEIKKQIGKAQKPKVVSIDGKRQAKAQASTDAASWQSEDGSYQVIHNAFFQIKADREGNPVKIKLCNFVAWITEELTNQDDLADKSYFVITGKREDGLALPPVDVPLAKFNLMSWVTEVWGARAIVYSGTTKKDNLRVAILAYSTRNGDIPHRVVYGRLGWIKLNDEWRYLTGSGAIGKDGLDTSIQVDMGGGHMAKYGLPAPPTQEQLKTDVAILKDLLEICPNRKEIGAVLLACIARAPLGECHPTDFAVFVHGQTGSLKSSVTAIALGFFGGFDARSFPANFSDSDSDLEGKAHQAKDAVFIVDDFKPATNQVEATRLHTKTERFIRNTGNQAGRGRRNPDMTTKPAPYNRSLTIMTGEDMPKGQSILARMLVLELCRNDVNIATLSRLQQAAHDGVLMRIMAGYILWLAAQLDTLKEAFPTDVREYRDMTLKQGQLNSHSRAPEMFANMVAAVFQLRQYLDSQNLSGLIEKDAIEHALLAAFKAQAEYQAEQDEVETFADLIRSVLSSGHGYIALAQNQSPPAKHPHRYGWRKSEGDIGPTYTPLGDCFGWLWGKDGEDWQIWLEPKTAYRLAVDNARRSGEPFLMGSGTLWRRMDNRGLLLEVEKQKNGTSRKDPKKTIAGVRTRVIVVAENWLLPTSDALEEGNEDEKS